MQYLLWNSARWSSTGLPMTCARIGDPGGIRTRDLDLERVASWARLDDGVGLRLSIPDPVVRLDRQDDRLHLHEVAGLETRPVRHPHADRAARPLDREHAGRADRADPSDD